jgi:outer membrane protein TolC
MTRSFTALVVAFISVSSQAQEALTIERAVDLALRGNERAAIAETTAESAQARVQRARTFFFPQLSINSALQRNTGQLRSDDERRSLSATAIATQPLFDARAFPLYRFARLERDAARMSADEAKRLLAFDAADAFLTTLSFEGILRAAELRRDFAQTSLSDARARFEAGLVSSNDVTKAELELATAQRVVALARGDAQSALVSLANLVNADIPAERLVEPVALFDRADDPHTYTGQEVAQAQQRRKDISASRFRAESLRAFAEEPSRRFIPSLGLTAQSRNINDGPISDRNTQGLLAVTFNWPLFDAGIRRAERQERDAIARGAELQLDLGLRDVEQQIRGATAQLAAEQESIREAFAAAAAARKNAEETNELYRQGLASALELADANSRLFDAEVGQATARYRMAIAYLTLREARGEQPLE